MKFKITDADEKIFEVDELESFEENKDEKDDEDEKDKEIKFSKEEEKKFDKDKPDFSDEEIRKLKELIPHIDELIKLLEKDPMDKEDEEEKIKETVKINKVAEDEISDSLEDEYIDDIAIKDSIFKSYGSIEKQSDDKDTSFEDVVDITNAWKNYYGGKK